MSLRDLNRPVAAGRVRRWHLPLVSALALCLLVGALVGYAGGRSAESAYADHLRATVVLNAYLPPASAAGPQLNYFPPVAAQSGSILIQDLDPVLNQGQIGQCQCDAFKYQWDYQYLRATGQHRRFSCKLWYTLLSRGQNVGSFFDQYTPLLTGVGGVLHRQYDWSSSPTLEELQRAYPVPGSILRLAEAHRYTATVDVISMLPGGRNAVRGAKAEILAGNPVNFSHSVFDGPLSDGDFRATTTGVIDIPAGQPPVDYEKVGGHAVTFIAFDNHRCFETYAGRTCGAFLGINQWTRLWSIYNPAGQYAPGNAGAAWYTYRFVAHYGNDLESLRLSSIRPQASRPQAIAPPRPNHSGPAADIPRTPPPTASRLPLPAPTVGTDQQWVYHVYARDTGQDLAPAINYWSHRIGVSPIGSLALIEAECGLYTTSTRCDANNPPYDVSFGCCQITVSTAAQFGIGSGVYDGYWGPNVTSVRNYENVAPNGIRLMSAVLDRFASYERNPVGGNCPGASQWPNLYVAWNAGPGQPCWWLLSPGGQAGANYYNNFLPWFRIAGGYARYGADPYAAPPRPFPLTVWCSYAAAHHQRCPAARDRRGHLTWPAVILAAHPRLGGKLPHDRWYGPSRRAHRRHGFMVYAYARGHAVAWPSFHTYRVVLR